MADMEVLAPGGHQHLVDKIKEQLAMKADASLASAVEKVIENQPTAVLSGTVLTASDTYAEPPVSLTVDGKSTQDGTPTPDAPVEIVSLEQVGLKFVGKNMLKPNATSVTSAGITVEIDADGWVTVTGTSTAATRIINLYLNGGETIELRPSTSYTNSVDGTHANFSVALYTTGGGGYLSIASDRSSSTVTVGSTPVLINRLAIIFNAGVTINARFRLQLELGSTATPYQPYDGTSVLLNLTQALRSLPDGTKDTLALTYLRPSTREGWAWYARELVQRVMHSELTEDTPGEWAFGETPNSHGIYNNNITPTQSQFIALFPNYTSSNSYIIIGKTSVGVSNRGSAANATIQGIAAYLSTHRVYLRTDTQQDATTLAAMFAHGPVDIDYIAAEPITTQLDPIELPVLPAPTCTVWSDPSTGLQMRYVRDMQIVIDSLNSEIERAYAAIAPVESTTAKSNHAVGDYLMLGGTLCKVTSAIASGETIAIGTNVAATTVDTELASLE